MSISLWLDKLAKRTYKRRDSDVFWGPLFMAPAIILLVVLRFYPLLRGIGYSMTNWDGIHVPEYIGFANYERLLFHDPLFRTSVINFLKVVMTLPIWVFLPLILALAIYQKVPGARFFRIAFFLPYVLSVVIVASIFTMVLRMDGAINSFLRMIGLDALRTDWLGTLDTALPAVIGVAIWASFGLGVLIFLAALATMNDDLIDAATVDGANGRQMLWHVVMPSIRPTIEFYTVLQIKQMLAGMFVYIFILTSGGPGSSTYLPEFLIWENMGALNKLGYASAIGTTIFFLFMFVIIIQIRMMTRRD
jgi:multiple sugar transport system permease protein